MRSVPKSLKRVPILSFLRDFSRDWCFVPVRLSFDMKTIVFVQIFPYFSKMLSKIENFEPTTIKKWMKGNINVQMWDLVSYRGSGRLGYLSSIF